MGQQVFSDRPTCVDLTHHLTLFNSHVVQEGLAERRATGDQLDGFGADAWCGHIKQHQADAQLLLGIRVGTHQTEHPISLISVGSPDLLAINNKMITLINRTALQAGKIGAGARLAVTLTPTNLAANDWR